MINNPQITDGLAKIPKRTQSLGYTLVPVASTDLPILDALGAMWEAIREQNSAVPAASFDLQPTRSSSCGTVEWDTAPIVVLNLKDASGQNLPARDILFLLLHLASHAASHEATGSESRYHSADFAEAARGLGLAVSSTRVPGVGYQPEGLARGTLSRYQAQIRGLGKALASWKPDTVRKRARSPLAYTCSCEPSRRLWMHEGVASKGPVTCGVCGELFVAASVSASS